MKKNLHPAYRTVVFQDVSAGKGFITRSSITAKDTVTWEDGKTYPLVKVDVSAFSHPFYTGQQKVLDTAGRIDRFKKRFVASEGKTVDRKATKTQPKRLAHVGSQKKEKTLSSAPKKDEKDAKKAAPKKDAKAAKKD